MPSPSTYLTSKTLVPSDLRTRDWDRVDTWCRERAYYMASVEQADILEEFRRQAQAILSGKVSAAQARETIRRMLDAKKYEAPEGLKGTIKDLRTKQRRDVSLQTNVDMANGWAQYRETIGNVRYPGTMLVRTNRRKQPRDWVAICARFSGRDDVLLTSDPDAPMAALSNSPVWATLSRWGRPCPPFDYGSGMWTRPLSYDECVSMGLITEANEDEMLDRVEQAAPETLNADLAVEREYSSPDLRKALDQQLQGLAKWEGNKLVCTDPNGSKPYGWQDVADIITAPLPEGIPHYQRDALADWVEDHSRFEGDIRTDSGKIVGLDEREDLIRLFRRINSESSDTLKDSQGNPVTLYRTLRLPEDVLKKIIKDGYSSKPGKIADSWAVDQSGAQKYMTPPMRLKPDERNVTIVCDNYKSAKPIHAAVRAVKELYSSPDPTRPLATDGEVITMAGTKFKVIRAEKQRIKTREGNNSEAWTLHVAEI